MDPNTPSLYRAQCGCIILPGWTTTEKNWEVLATVVQDCCEGTFTFNKRAMLIDQHTPTPLTPEQAAYVWDAVKEKVILSYQCEELRAALRAVI